MVADPTIPNRVDLEAMARGNNRVLIALERLFQVAGDITPTDVDSLQQQAQGAAVQQAATRAITASALNVAEAALSAAHLKTAQIPSIPQLQEAIASAHRRNRQEGHLARLQDVVAPAPTDGDLLSWSAATNKWIPVAKVSGATGTFTTVDSKTVTVDNGTITSIV